MSRQSRGLPRRQWLRKLLDDAHNPELADRNALLDQASARLDQELLDQQLAAGGGRGEPQPAFAQARREANAILARKEFRIVSGQSWLDRKVAHEIAAQRSGEQVSVYTGEKKRPVPSAQSNR